MRAILFLCFVTGLVGFTEIAKAQAIQRLLENSDKVAACTTVETYSREVNFYVNKVTPMIVAEFSGPKERYYMMDLEENKSTMTLYGNTEIMGLAFDLFFKASDRKFTVTFKQDTVRDPGVKEFKTELIYDQNKTLGIHCLRTAN